MEDFFDQDKTEAFVYLMSEGDDKNKVLLSDDKLMIIRRNKRESFLLKDISRLQTEIKKLLLPLILGGIITPFAFISYFVNLFLPWIHLISVMMGLLLFYIGWTGKSAFTVIYKNGEEVFFYLPSISKNLMAFSEFVNFLLRKPKDSIHGNLLYFILENQSPRAFIEKTRSTDPAIFPLKGFTLEQLKQKNKSINTSGIIAINPKKAGREIKFFYDSETNQMRPVIDGPILPESIEGSHKFP